MVKFNMKNKIHRVIEKMSRHKRKILITAFVIILFSITLTGVAFSYHTWNDYQVKYDKYFDDAKVDIDKIILQSDSDKSTNALNNLAKLQLRLKVESREYCNITSLVEWQKFIGKYSDELSDCNQKKNRLLALLDNIGEVVDYLKAENELSSIILIANDGTNQNNQADKWNKVEVFWRTAANDASKLNDSQQFSETKILAVDKLTKIADSWRDLSVANDAKNRQQFEVAHASVISAYGTLSEISSSADTKLDVMIADLSADYDKAF